MVSAGAESGGVFSQTLREITTTKLEELSKRRNVFEAAKSAALAGITQNVTHDAPSHISMPIAIARLKRLAAGVKKAMSLRLDKSGHVAVSHGKDYPLQSELRNLDKFLAQAEYDPSVNLALLHKWETSLVQHLEAESLRFQYATLYGELVTEWLEAEARANKGHISSAGDGMDVEMAGEPFEDVDDSAKIRSRIQWEKMVFEPADIDETALQRYLVELFGNGDPKNKEVAQALHTLRLAVANFESQFAAMQFDVASLQWVIKGLLNSGRITEDKKEVLRDFEKDPIIQAEISDVLNMRKDAMHAWSWGKSVAVEQRRQISGIYNIQVHEDLLQAMLLQYVGVKWSIFFGAALRNFRGAEGTWKSNRREVPVVDQKRLEYYLGAMNQSDCLQSQRQAEYRKNFFMARLLRSENEHVAVQDGEEEAEVKARDRAPGMAGAGMQAQKPLMAQQMQVQMPAAAFGASRFAAAPAPPPSGGLFGNNNNASKRQREVYDMDEDFGYDHDAGRPKTPMELKQHILHLLSADTTISKELRGELTAFHSAFDNWNPRLAHQTIKTVLAFFGVSHTWLDFFARFLEAPLQFADDDDESTEPRIRRRGAPATHVLSDVFSEVVLFTLDFSVNQAAGGSILWRFGDDFWFWDSNHQTCVTAWKAVQRFCAVTGSALRYSPDHPETTSGKSGCVRVVRQGQPLLPIDPILPKGYIGWGFLLLDPTTGRFAINNDMVTEHIIELRKQLENKRPSVFGFIQAWNTFANRFFASNFGMPANSFGRSHVDEMLAAHARIQRDVFSSLAPTGRNGMPCIAGGQEPTNIIDFLKTTIRARFGIEDIPDGWLYFPQSLGGLGLASPFVSLLQSRDAVLASPDPLIQGMHAAEERQYQGARLQFINNFSFRKSQHNSYGGWAVPQGVNPNDPNGFLSFEEYTRYREEYNFGHDSQVHHVWRKLVIDRVPETSVEQDGRLQAAFDVLGTGFGRPGDVTNISSNWHDMTPYWRWVSNMYGPEIVQKFGGLRIVDRGVLPMGMVSLFMGRKVTWK